MTYRTNQTHLHQRLLVYALGRIHPFAISNLFELQMALAPGEKQTKIIN